jgi:diaminopimelate epimerase
MSDAGRRFWKMSGSGNDFVFFDARDWHREFLDEPGAIQRLCDRRLGVGADGVVFLERAPAPARFRMAYFNSDGSRASMCGNAALCSTRLAVELGAVPADGFVFESDAGRVHARLRDGSPEVDLAAVRDVEPDLAVDRSGGEVRIGFAIAGVPHVVVLCNDVDSVPLMERAPSLRHAAVLGPGGANANFVSPDGRGGWRMRTFERGVEGETLACGTGAVACAAVLRAWELAPREGTVLTTRSGRPLGVSFTADDSGPSSLRGEGRIVYEGALREL